MNLADLCAKAAVVLSRRLGETAVLDEPVLIRDQTRSIVLRCRVRTDCPDLASVIVKQIREDDARGFSDWASLVFLSKIEPAQKLAPRFLGGDAADRFFLMEDLGGSATLQDVLSSSGDADRARKTLRCLAAQMGLLQATTLARNRSFAATRAALPGAAGLGRQSEARRWRSDLENALGWFRNANCVLPAGFGPCLERVAAVYARPGPFLAFTHGDPAPSNNHVASNGQVRLLDFEYGSFRHALYDLSAWNVLCPLPPDCVREMVDIFRAELAKACLAARDPARFWEAWAHLCVYRALAILTWISPDALRENRPWVDDSWTARHAVFAAVCRARDAVAAGSTPTLEPLGEALDRLASALRLRWPEFENAQDLFTRWPVFSSLPLTAERKIDA